MKKIFLLAFICTSINSIAQVSSITLQAAGLTCSMCNNSINKALKTLPFVANVVSNIANSSFDITVKPGAAVDFDDIKKKVEGAGFSVASLRAVVHFDHTAIENDGHVQAAGMTFHFLHVPNRVLNGDVSLQILDKGFVPARVYAKNTSYTKMACYKTGVASGCCAMGSLAAGTRIYHVTI